MMIKDKKNNNLLNVIFAKSESLPDVYKIALYSRDDLIEFNLCPPLICFTPLYDFLAILIPRLFEVT